VIEKAADYYAYCSILEVRVMMVTPALHVAGALGTYRHAQCAVVNSFQRDSAFGSDLAGFSTCRMIPAGQGYTVVVKPAAEARKHSVPSVIDAQAIKTVTNA